MKKLNSITVVIPAYNEEGSLPKLLTQVKKITDNIIVVDNSSTDNTYNIAKKHCKTLRNEKNFGKGYSLRRGFKEAKTDIIVMMDADLSHKPTEIPKLIQPLFLEKKVGLVIGSRILGGSEEFALSKLLGNDVLTKIFNLLFGTKYTDLLNGFKAMRKDITTDLRSNGFEIEVELICSCLKKEYVIREVPTYEIGRRTGKSKLNKLLDASIILMRILVEKYKF